MQQHKVSVRIVKLTTEQLDLLAKGFRLSPRETQVLDLLFEGLPTNQDIGDRLDTTAGAVQAAVRALFAKTGARSRHELMTICLKRDAQHTLAEAGRVRIGDTPGVDADQIQALRRRVAALEAQIRELLANPRKKS